jgi:hypothetical protein
VEGWAVAPLGGGVVGLSGDPSRPVRNRGGSDKDGNQALLIHRQAPRGGTWVLIAASRDGVCINGQPLATGMRVLQDKDTIRLRGGDWRFFSTECPARVAPFGATNAPVACPRCKQEIREGDSVVRCPGCGVAHHQAEEEGLPCWTGYPEQPFRSCALCDQQATLDGGFHWTPEDL